MKDKVTADMTYSHGSRAPNGKYWKFDCTWIQKSIYSNCWEGDTASGRACSFIDRYIFFEKCYDQKIALRVTATLAGMMALIYSIV